MANCKVIAIANQKGGTGCILRSLADSDAFQSGRSAAIADSIINSFWYQWQGLSPAL